LTLRDSSMQALLVARALGTAAKLASMTAAIALKAPLLWVGIAFGLDALTIALVCWWLNLRRQTSLVRQSMTMLGRVRKGPLAGHVVHAFWRSLPSTALIVAYNAMLRSDRLLMSRTVDEGTLSAQSVCMQFIDPTVMFLSGYVNNRFVRGAGMTNRQALQVVGGLVLSGALIAKLAPVAMAWLPSNIAAATTRFAAAGWLLPAYGCLALAFYTLYFRFGNGAASAALLLFGASQAALTWLSAQHSDILEHPYLLLGLVTAVSTCLLVWMLPPLRATSSAPVSGPSSHSIS
jgi:hypothetical protein